MTAYKYLGYHIQEQLSPATTADILTTSARRAFGRIISVFKKLKNMGYETYESLYESNILSIANYSSAIWGFKEHQGSRILFNKVGRFYLGTHTFMPTAALYLELDWLKNRIIKMPEHRWPKIIWDWSLAENVESWCYYVKLILSEIGLPDHENLYNQTDLEYVSKKLIDISQNKWHLEALGKPKLCTFVEIHNFEEHKLLLKANLERKHRSLVAKLKSGILPLRLETGHYKGMNREDRLCQVCDKNKVEDEVHFLFVCKKLKTQRKAYVKKIRAEFPSINKKDYLGLLRATLDSNHIKEFSVWPENMVYTRRNILYN